MTSTLPTRIKEKIADHGLTIASLERKANLPQGVVHKIVNGGIKNPGIETIWAIARALQCRIDSLIEEHENVYETAYSHDEKAIFIPDLYLDCDKFVNQYLKSRNIEFSMGEALDLIKEIYNYSRKNRTDFTIDPRFAEWTLDRHCSKRDKR